MDIEDLNLETNINEFKLNNMKPNTSLECVEIMGEALNISKAKLEQYSFNDWLELVENLGVLVFQFCNLNPKVLRGYALYYDKLPIIGINHRESDNAKKFTLFHELAHLLLKSSGVSNLASYDLDNELEIKCNAIVGEIISPKSILQSYISQEIEPNFCDEKLISNFAKRLNLSKEVIVRRLLTLNYISTNEYEKHKESFNKYINQKPKKRNNEKENLENEELATKLITTVGNYYISIVLDANDKGILSNFDLAKEFDVSIDLINFIKNKHYFDSRTMLTKI